jgi:antirestriction protein
MASIFVSTYAKHNAGNLFGAWFDLEDYACLQDFMEACAELHDDSWAKMAEELLDSTGALDAIPENLRYYFDYDAYARDIRLGGDMCEHDGYFFWNH